MSDPFLGIDHPEGQRERLAWVVGVASAAAMTVAYRTEPVLAICLVAMVAVSTHLSAIDLREHRLPNHIVGPLSLVVVFAVVIGGVVEEDLRRAGTALALGVATSVLLLLVHLAGGLGMGDVKYGFPAGATLGWFGAGAVFQAAVITTAVGAAVAVWMLSTGHGRGSRLPYGPCMAVGLVGALLAAAPW